MSLLTHNSAKPIILPSGRMPPPTPYTGTQVPHGFMTISPNGELFITFGDSPGFANGVNYRSTNYGGLWTPFADGGGVGAVPVIITPTAAGYVADCIDLNIYFSLTGLPGSWAAVADFSSAEDAWCTHGAGDAVWVCGVHHYGGINTSQCRLSLDGGQTWNWAVKLPHVISQNMSQIRVNVAETHALLINTSLARLIYSNNPKGIYTLWTGRPNTGDNKFFGVVWPRVVIPKGGGFPHGVDFEYSTDMALTYVTKTLPVAMQGDATFRVGVDLDPFNTDRVLAIVDGTTPGMWMSEDWGVSWSFIIDEWALPRLGGEDFPAVRFDPYKENYVYAWGRTGFWRSIDGGFTWEPRSLGIA